MSISVNHRLPSVILYCDGGSRGNPGISGAGFAIFREGKEIFSGKKFLGITTNNVAEYTALILGMKKGQELGAKVLHCFLDSEIVVKQLNGLYRVKHPNMIPLFLEVKKLSNSFEKITFTHIPREKNKRADELANEAMDKWQVL